MRLIVPVVSALVVVLASAPHAQTGRKVYISVDMEGISGVNGDDQTSAGQAEYGRARKLMVEDANAAIRGAFAGGATDVLVNDSHGGQRNLLPEDLDPRARLISHSFKRHGMMEGLDESFDSVLFIGRAGLYGQVVVDGRKNNRISERLEGNSRQRGIKIDMRNHGSRQIAAFIRSRTNCPNERLRGGSPVEARALFITLDIPT